MAPLGKIKTGKVVPSRAPGVQLDPPSTALALDNAEYAPDQLPGLVCRLKDPKTAALLFRSGKVVCTGAKSIEAVGRAVDIVTSRIEASGVKVDRNPEITVQNIVASADLHADLNLNAIAIGLGLEKVEYEPEQFPGLVYRMDNPKVVVLLFGSGKLVCTGAKKPEDAERAVDQITEELQGLGLL